MSEPPPSTTALSDLPCDDIQRLLQRHGILPTQQRVDVARILFSCARHLSADQVLAIANRERHAVSKATVYNTLGLFADKGMVREVIVDPTKVFYDPNPRLHHHFYNLDTNELIDIPGDRLQVGPIPVLPEGTVVEQVEVIVKVRDGRNRAAPPPDTRKAPEP